MTLKKAGKLNKRLLGILLCTVMSFCCIPSVTVEAANKRLNVKTAMSMGISVSKERKTAENDLALAKAEYSQSVKKLKIKQKNQSTFKWSPLLKFKFPEDPSFADEYEYTFEPIRLQTVIDVKAHKLADVKYSVYESVAVEFCKVYELQEEIAFTEEQIEKAEDGLAKNSARLKLGTATQADVDSAQSSLDSLKSKLDTYETNFSTEKTNLGRLIGIDVMVGYTFESPFIDVEISESMLQSLIDYTKENDHNFYSTKVDTTTGLLSLETNYSLMKNKYGGKMSLIDSFINQAKRGEEIDSSAFMLKYKEFLVEIDKKWQGKKKILFIKFPKLYLKGDTDGINYIEDEPNGLYTAALEYQNLVVEQNKAEEELANNVEANFRNYINSRKSIAELEEKIAEEKDSVAADKLLNAQGKLTYEEYTSSVEEYESDQMDLISSKSEYSQLLYSFDRLTCGAITNLMSGTDVSFGAANAGESYVVEDEGSGVYYSIKSVIADNAFELSVTVSEDFEGSVTNFELWVGDTQIGERCEVGKSIRHLTIDLENSDDAVKIRLYDGDDWVDDCEIDPEVYSGKLVVTLARNIETNDKTQVAEYTMSISDTTGLSSLSISPKAGEMIASYNIKTESGNMLGSGEKIAVNSSFRYLPMTDEDLEALTICFYDEDENLLYECRFNTSDSTIHKKEE